MNVLATRLPVHTETRSPRANLVFDILFVLQKHDDVSASIETTKSKILLPKFIVSSDFP